jgi:hypothetical protein
LLHELSWRQFLAWKAYDELEPIGGLRGDWHAASICTMLANIAAAQSGSKKRFRVADFLLEFGPERAPIETPRQTWQEQKMIAMMCAAAANSKKR